MGWGLGSWSWWRGCDGGYLAQNPGCPSLTASKCYEARRGVRTSDMGYSAGRLWRPDAPSSRGLIAILKTRN